jgi:hypothetical protein
VHIAKLNLKIPMDEDKGIPKLGLNISPKLSLGNKLYMKK